MWSWKLVLLLARTRIEALAVEAATKPEATYSKGYRAGLRAGRVAQADQDLRVKSLQYELEQHSRFRGEAALREVKLQQELVSHRLEWEGRGQHADEMWEKMVNLAYATGCEHGRAGRQLLMFIRTTDRGRNGSLVFFPLTKPESDAPGAAVPEDERTISSVGLGRTLEDNINSGRISIWRKSYPHL